MIPSGMPRSTERSFTLRSPSPLAIFSWIGAKSDAAEMRIARWSRIPASGVGSRVLVSPSVSMARANARTSSQLT